MSMLISSQTNWFCGEFTKLVCNWNVSVTKTNVCITLATLLCFCNSCKNDTDDVFYNELHFYDKIQINVSVMTQHMSDYKCSVLLLQVSYFWSLKRIPEKESMIAPSMFCSGRWSQIMRGLVSRRIPQRSASLCWSAIGITQSSSWLWSSARNVLGLFSGRLRAALLLFSLTAQLDCCGLWQLEGLGAWRRWWKGRIWKICRCRWSRSAQ